ncbi:MAG: hypothetical protein K6B68_04435 [Eubacterium sp.]|nr:hypothetical protein [Eubacterium sp.]
MDNVPHPQETEASGNMKKGIHTAGEGAHFIEKGLKNDIRVVLGGLYKFHTISYY